MYSSQSKICPARLTVFVVSLSVPGPEAIHHPLCHFGSSAALQELPFVSFRSREPELQHQPAPSSAAIRCHCLGSFSSSPLLLCPFCEQTVGQKVPSLARRLEVQVRLFPPHAGGLSKQEGGMRGKPVQLAPTEVIFPSYPCHSVDLRQRHIQ